MVDLWTYVILRLFNLFCFWTPCVILSFTRSCLLAWFTFVTVGTNFFIPILRLFTIAAFPSFSQWTESGSEIRLWAEKCGRGCCCEVLLSWLISFEGRNNHRQSLLWHHKSCVGGLRTKVEKFPGFSSFTISPRNRTFWTCFDVFTWMKDCIRSI